MLRNSAFVLFIMLSIIFPSCKTDKAKVVSKSLENVEKVMIDPNLDRKAIPPGLETQLGQNDDASLDTLAKMETPAKPPRTQSPLKSASNSEPPIGLDIVNASEPILTGSTALPVSTPVSAKTLPESIHAIWDKLLQQHVDSDGMVNYKAFLRDSMLLNEYLKTLSEVQLESLNRNELIAFWINAYNAFTIKLIIQNYPVKSIMNLGNGKIWDKSWIILNQKKLSLNDIEHNILFKQFPDARYHFALVCAARSCPPLLNKAWKGETLDKTLHSRTQLFIRDTTFNQISKNALTLSKLFEWYRSDFGDIIAYINKFQMTHISEDASITYKEYDWDLNEK